MNHLPHVLLVAAGLAPATVAAGYLFALTALGWRAPRKVRCEVHTRFGILIPAHDEQTHLGAALESVRASDYPAGLARAFVVADNCGDATAAVARSAGAWCGERRDATRIGKGHALGWGLAQMPPRELDAVLILDADCRLDPEALTHLAEAFQSGALAAQTAVLADPGTTPAGVVAAVGSEVESAIQAGYTRLGLGVWPRGTGMAFRARLAWAHPVGRDRACRGRAVWCATGGGGRHCYWRAAGNRPHRQPAWRFTTGPPAHPLARGTIPRRHTPHRPPDAKQAADSRASDTNFARHAAGPRHVRLPNVVHWLDGRVGDWHLRGDGNGLPPGTRAARRHLARPPAPHAAPRRRRATGGGGAWLARHPARLGARREGDAVTATRPNPLRRLWPGLAAESRPTSGPVRLTFDDGPHPTHTPRVLARLAHYGIKATFFAVGLRVAESPGVAREVVDAGHEVGNHTYRHRVPKLWDGHASVRDILAAQSAIRDAAGVNPRRFRPPLGRLTPAQLFAARRLGLTVTLWTLDSNDWRGHSAGDAVTCGRAIAASARPGDVILLHDDRPHAAELLAELLPRLADSGLV